jgi:hypothetical protein
MASLSLPTSDRHVVGGEATALLILILWPVLEMFFRTIRTLLDARTSEAGQHQKPVAVLRGHGHTGAVHKVG